jgi:hypothetical protein
MVRRVEASVGAIRAEAARVAPRPTTPERRIAEGELHLRNQDYERAIQIFSQVDELFRQGNVPASAHADALFLLGESYFRSDQLLSARRRSLEILDGIRQRAYAPYAGRALSRLVDIALRTEDPAAVDALAARLAELPDADATGSLQYARGKLAFARRDYVTARRELAGVPANVPFTHQSQYLLGVVFTKEALVQPAAEPGAGAEGGAAQPGSIVRFAAAVDQFGGSRGCLPTPASTGTSWTSRGWRSGACATSPTATSTRPTPTVTWAGSRPSSRRCCMSWRGCTSGSAITSAPSARSRCSRSPTPIVSIWPTARCCARTCGSAR